MKITVSGLLSAVLVLAGCASGRFVNSDDTVCNGGGYAVAKVVYGDSRIKVPPVINLERGSEFRVKLIPKRDNIPEETATRNLEVTVVGDTANDPASVWITARTTTFNDSLDGYMTPLCVPMDLSEGDYKYRVEIEVIGSLDPRAHVG